MLLFIFHISVLNNHVGIIITMRAVFTMHMHNPLAGGRRNVIDFLATRTLRIEFPVNMMGQ